MSEGTGAGWEVAGAQSGVQVPEGAIGASVGSLAANFSPSLSLFTATKIR